MNVSLNVNNQPTVSRLDCDSIPRSMAVVADNAMESKQSPDTQLLSRPSVHRSETTDDDSNNDDVHDVHGGTERMVLSLCPEAHRSSTQFSTVTATPGHGHPECTSPTTFDEAQSSPPMVVQLQSYTAPSPFCGAENSAPSSFGGTKSRAAPSPQNDDSKPPLPRTQSLHPMRSTLLTPRCLKGSSAIL